jgi:hypothetical protein
MAKSSSFKNPTKGKTLVIKRSRWLRGTEDTCLRDGHGDMCCLGFDAWACGVSADDIENISDPCDLYISISMDAADILWEDNLLSYFKTRMKFEAGGNTKDVELAIEINDREGISDTEREKRLIPVLKRIGGYKVVKFID